MYFFDVLFTNYMDNHLKTSNFKNQCTQEET